MPRKKRVMDPHFRMTTLDMFVDGWEPKRRTVSVDALKDAYDKRTLEDQVGVKVREKS